MTWAPPPRTWKARRTACSATFSAYALGDIAEAMLQLKKVLRYWGGLSAPLIAARLRARLSAMLDAMEASEGRSREADCE